MPQTTSRDLLSIFVLNKNNKSNFGLEDEPFESEEGFEDLRFLTMFFIFCEGSI
jgi:hypothetical protein